MTEEQITAKLTGRETPKTGSRTPAQPGGAGNGSDGGRYGWR